MEKVRAGSIILVALFINIVFAQIYQPDLNGDKFVDFADFALLAENWQKSGTGLTGDIDNSGMVGIQDLFNFIEKWLQCSYIIYVDANAVPGGDGGSWNNAFNYLQDAITVADRGYEIWVAQGIYRPDANNSFPNGNHLRTSTFQLPEGVAIYGGFSAGSSSLQQRDWVNNQTILSGDIGIAGIRSDNCYNIVSGANDIILDGFIIADGNATGTGNSARGGGMRNEDVNDVIIANCTFRDNFARYDGGAIYNYESAISFINCVFSENDSGDDGGGVYNSNTNSSLKNCSFSDNYSVNRGGGIYNYESDSELINCLFKNNHADSNGGAVYNGYKTVKLINCTIAENSADGNTGGIYNNYSSSVITNCIVWDNGTSICNRSCNPHILHSDIESCGDSGINWDPNFGEDDGNNIDCDPCFAERLALKAESSCIDAGKNLALPLKVTTDANGNTRFNNFVDMGAYEFGQLDIHQDTDNDNMPDWWEFRFFLDPNDANNAQNDVDEDGLTNINEYENNCDAIFFDTDNDLLPDGWEVSYNLNPSMSDIIEIVDGNNVYADSDSDGLDMLKEVIYGSNPAASDTDADGAHDGAEVAQAGLPADATDLGLPPSADKICQLRLTVGDWSNSNSERYDLKVGPITHQAARFGVVETKNYNQFRPGRYEVRVVHRGTDPSKWYYPNADYDYVAQIETVSLPAGVIMQIEDPYGILGYHGDSNTPNHIFDAAGKIAYLNLTGVKITEPNGNPANDNHFVFDSSSSGICNVAAAGTTGLSEMDSDLQWQLTAITGSTQASSPNPAKGANITFTYIDLPVSNSEFGEKTLTLTYPPTSQQDTKQVKIFFSKSAGNNPGGTNPNWYYYWKQTAASSGNHEYDGSTSYYGYYIWGQSYFHIGDLACGSNSWTGHDGIDTFAETCLHENKHKTNYETWWAPLGGYNAQYDQDGDYALDSAEPALGLNPNNWDTDGDGWNDEHDLAYDVEFTWSAGSANSSDWATPGHQY